MKFRKKPVIIEAFKWTGGPDQKEDPEWCVEEIKKGNIIFEGRGTSDVKMAISPSGTLEGVMVANQGDWIIKGSGGEVYPCKPDIFEACYEAVE